MKIARITSDERGETDRVLSEIASRFQSDGVNVAGIVKDHSHASSFDNGCDMKVCVLPDGPVIQITQNLGGGSAACRLDPGAIAEAVSRVEAGALDQSALFILNKFGPEEAAGRGFISAIGKAMEHDVPVLVGVGPGGAETFDTFADGMAEVLPADVADILAWCHAAMSDQA